VTAAPEVRARRRYEEFRAKGIDTTLEQVYADMLVRDKRDQERDTAPMKPASDAVLMDTSDMNTDEEIAAAVAVIDARLQQSSKA
jgi:cytidylate kinase